MKKTQRFILIIGAVLFVIAIASTPSVIEWKGHWVSPAADDTHTPHFPHPVIATVRGIVVLVVTMLLYYAFRDKQNR